MNSGRQYQPHGRPSSSHAVVFTNMNAVCRIVACEQLFPTICGLGWGPLNMHSHYTILINTGERGIEADQDGYALADLPNQTHQQVC